MLSDYDGFLKREELKCTYLGQPVELKIMLTGKLFNFAGTSNYYESTLVCYIATGYAFWNRNKSLKFGRF